MPGDGWSREENQTGWSRADHKEHCKKQAKSGEEGVLKLFEIHQKVSV